MAYIEPELVAKAKEMDVLQPFIEEVLPGTKKSKHCDFSDITVMNDIIAELLSAAYKNANRCSKNSLQ